MSYLRPEVRYLRETIHRFIAKVLPLGTKRREGYEKLWYILHIIKSWGFHKLISELRRYLLTKMIIGLLNKNLVIQGKTKRGFFKTWSGPINPIYNDLLKKIDQRMNGASPEEIVQLFETIPLNIFGLLSLKQLGDYPNINNFFPEMPPEQLQKTWVGSSGISLLKTTLLFVCSLVSYYKRYCENSIKKAKILDYGCGWGRMFRVLYKYVPTTNLFGVDPSEDIIEMCNRNGVKGNLSLCDYIPKDLPFGNQKFDLIFAFSVFTHLSEKCHEAVLRALYDRLNKKGILVVTIRPRFFWLDIPGFDEEKRKSAIEAHDSYGYAFHPHNRPPIDGDITYGDTSISLEYIQKNWKGWKLIHTDHTSLDPYQIYCVFRKN